MQNAHANFNCAKELIQKKFIYKSEHDRLNVASLGAITIWDKAVKALSDIELKAPFSG
ncbi:MAG: hypothetical protein KAQ91_10290 [Methylococcales bacterium]|nr:hypothetical protein [Methylococcales bacterium]